jgi:hypothetical protein
VSANPSFGILRHLFTAIALSMLSACTALSSADSPQEYLDKDTAATINVVGRPMVFARDRSERAAHARDYVTVAAATVDRGGKTDYVVIAYFWSTLDAHDEPHAAQAPAAADIVFAADDRRITLHLEGHSAHDIGIGVPVHAPPARSVIPNVYRTDLATLRYLSAAHHLAVVAADSDMSYELWDDRRAALGSLVRLLSGE